MAARDGTTLRTLVEQGLRHELNQRKTPSSFRLRKASFKGTGLQPGAVGLTWDQIRDLALQRTRRMIAVDTKVLVYAHREDSEWHTAASRKLASLAEGKAAWTIP